MLDFFHKGGPLMYPLFLCSVIALTFALERTYHYLRAKGKKELFAEIKILLQKRDYERALEMAKTGHGPVAAVLFEAINNRGKGVSVLEEAISLKGSHELKRLNKNLHILELIGRIAPLIGLLGTVLGMVEAFKTVSSVKGAVEPAILAGGIWEALLTTVAGLCIAIPALVIHHLFEDKVNTIVFQMKHSGAEIINLMGEKE